MLSAYKSRGPARRTRDPIGLKDAERPDAGGGGEVHRPPLIENAYDKLFRYVPCGNWRYMVLLTLAAADMLGCRGWRRGCAGVGILFGL